MPAEEREHVEERLGVVAFFAVAGRHLARHRIGPVEREHRKAEAVAVAFAQLAVAVGFQQQGQVGELGHHVFPAEGAVEQHMQRSRGQPFLPADHVGDLHEVIVHHIGEVVGRHAVALKEHLIVEQVRLHAHLATDEVVQHDGVEFGDLEADHIGFARREATIDFFLRQDQGILQVEAGGAAVGERAAGGFQLFATGFQLLRRVERVVGVTALDQLQGILPVDGLAFALSVGRMGTIAETDPFVRFDAAPFEGFDDVFLGARDEALLVGILNAQNEIATFLLGKQVVIKGRPNPAHMQGPGRTRRKTNTGTAGHGVKVR